MNSLQYRQLAKRVEDAERRLTEIEKALESAVVKKALAALAPKPRKETLGLGTPKAEYQRKANNA